MEPSTELTKKLKAWERAAEEDRPRVRRKLQRKYFSTNRGSQTPKVAEALLVVCFESSLTKLENVLMAFLGSLLPNNSLKQLQKDCQKEKFPPKTGAWRYLGETEKCAWVRRHCESAVEAAIPPPSSPPSPAYRGRPLLPSWRRCFLLCTLWIFLLYNHSHNFAPA